MLYFKYNTPSYTDIKNDVGALTPLMGLVFVVIFGAVMLTMTLDHSFNKQVKSQHIADAAALYTVDAIRREKLADPDADLSTEDLQAFARDVFEAYLTNEPVVLTSLTLNYVVDGVAHYIDIDYEVEVTNMYDEHPIRIRDSTSAAIDLTPHSLYMDVSFLLDISKSMGTGASYEDQVAMWTTQNCAFACHQADIATAQQHGIQVRLDSLYTALRIFFDEVEFAITDLNLAADATKMRFLWFFDEAIMNSGADTDVEAARQLLDMTEAYSNTWGDSTNLAAVLDRFSTYFAQPNGDGASAENRKAFVFLVTDGMASHGDRTHISSGDLGIVDRAYCDRIKADGTTLGVVLLKYENYANTMHTAYGPNVENGHAWNSLDYSGWLQHYLTHALFPNRFMTHEMRDCASPDFFFEAANTTEFNEAMVDLFAQAVLTTQNAPRLIHDSTTERQRQNEDDSDQEPHTGDEDSQFTPWQDLVEGDGSGT